ncbi:MAG: hypothetical protein PF445_00515 [Melioribacteraceae bacterium]|nr:hypothetical protein [Melioribacteraceae bacterium]
MEGDERSKLFEMLTDNPRTGDSSIYWNFEKFLIDKDGYIVDRFRSFTKPESEDLKSLIEKLLSDS